MMFFSTFNQIGKTQNCVCQKFFFAYTPIFRSEPEPEPPAEKRSGAGAARGKKERGRSRPREKGAGAAKMGRLRNPDMQVAGVLCDLFIYWLRVYSLTSLPASSRCTL